MIDFRSVKYGLEIETTGRSRSVVAAAIQSAVGGEVEHVGYPSTYDPYHLTDSKGRVWKVVADASLTDVPHDLRAEIVTPILTYQDIPDLQQVVRSVRQSGSRASQSCGLHMHIDGSLFTGRTLANLVKTFYKYQELIVQAFGVRPERLEKYCKLISPELIRRIEKKNPQSIEDINRVWFDGRYDPNPGRYDSTRYSVLNLVSLFRTGSVEIRAANSSLHAGVVRAYLAFALALAAKALNSRCASSKPRRYDPASAKYDFRIFAIIHLGLMGEEFRNVRRNLLANLTGDSAFKHGRKRTDKPAAETTEVCCEAS